jgi:hypothetical protein
LLHFSDLVSPCFVLGENPVFTTKLDREDCSFISSGANPYMPLTFGMQSTLEGEVDDDEEMVDTGTGVEREYESQALTSFAPILDTAAFQACD